jgi:ABC-2 type transport system permease protein
LIRSILNVAAREWSWLRLQRRYLALVLSASLAFIVTLGIIYSPKKVLHVPVVVVDQDHSRLSRELTTAIPASETFSFAGYANSAEEFSALAASDRAHVCFVFPAGLERDLLAHRPARVQVFIDYSNYLAGTAELSAANSILSTYSVGAEMRSIEAAAGVTKSTAFRLALPFDAGTRMWFNPAFNGNYLNILVVGLAYCAVQLAGLFLVIRAGSSEFAGRYTTPLGTLTSSPWIALAGKLLPYFLIAAPLSIVITHAAHWLFGAPLIESHPSFWLVLFWFDAMLVTLGYGLSCLAREPVFATEMCASITMPNFLLSGYTWPIFAMPKIMWIAAYGLPMYSIVFMTRKITLMGGSIADCGPQLIALSAWSLVALALAWNGTRKILAAEKSREAAHD